MKLYEGRVGGQAVPLMDLINRSLPFDIRLLPFDVATNKAWAGELTRLGVFSDDAYADVLKVLDGIVGEYEAGAFDPLPADEDIHTLTERRLTEELGAVGARIHTGRSRNDQVATDVRLYTRDALQSLMADVRHLVNVLVKRSDEHKDTLLAGTTHLQPALPVSLAHFLCSCAWAVVRDHGRLQDAHKRTNLSPLGSGAMAGSGFPVDREALAKALGFDGVLENSIDAVSDRDFIQETVYACTLLCNHLSRYAEQFIIWANPAFGYIRFADAWSTGSSMMPQKRNPDAMELIRGKAARLQGSLNTLLTMTKGLPLTYAKDLQEDKEPLFDALDTTALVVKVFSEAVDSATFNPDKLSANLSGDMLATDLADALARAGVPFRAAHERVAKLVTRLESDGRDLLQVKPEDLGSDFDELGGELKLDFQASVEARNVQGGTNPERVNDALAKLKAWSAERSPASF